MLDIHYIAWTIFLVTWGVTSLFGETHKTEEGDYYSAPSPAVNRKVNVTSGSTYFCLLAWVGV